MRRRDFITVLGGAVATWPLAVRAQQPALPVIGHLGGETLESSRDRIAAFHLGMGEAGFVEGRNVTIDYRWAEYHYDRLPGLARELASRQVAVITTTDTASALAAQKATTSIPIVFSLGSDPVKFGLVASLNRPGGNVTGIASLSGEVERKKLELIHELLPRATRFAILDTGTTNSGTVISDLQAAADSIGVKIDVFYADTNAAIDEAFAALVQKQTEALLVQSLFFFRDRRTQILTLAARHAIPVIYGGRADVETGGLMSYGPNQTDNAKTLGIAVSPTLLALADEVIE